MASIANSIEGGAHHQLAEGFLRALSGEQNDHRTWVQRAILKQEVWRLLVTLRASGEDNSGAVAEFEALIPGLAQHMEMVSAEQEAAREVDERLREALQDVRGWPLV